MGPAYDWGKKHAEVFNFICKWIGWWLKFCVPLVQGCPKSILEGRCPVGFGCFPPSTHPDTSACVINRHVLTLMTSWWQPLIRIRCVKSGKNAKPAGLWTPQFESVCSVPHKTLSPGQRKIKGVKCTSVKKGQLWITYFFLPKQNWALLQEIL